MTLEPLSITLHVLPVDISKAIAAYKADTTPFRVVIFYCPLFQALEREGYKPKGVGIDAARLESGTWSLDEVGKKVTRLYVNDWESISLPFTVVLTPRVTS